MAQLDETVVKAMKDSATVTADGATLAKSLAGVITRSPVNHVDHRGRVFEIFSGDAEFWSDPVVYCYGFTVRANQTKGWGLHEEKDDRYTLISGELFTILYDARLDSPTHGQSQKVVLTAQHTRQLLIPKGVWHMNIALSEQEVQLINHPTKVYEHGKPDRHLLPYDTDLIPVNVRDYFPKQFH